VKPYGMNNRDPVPHNVHNTVPHGEGVATRLVLCLALYRIYRIMILLLIKNLELTIIFFFLALFLCN